MQFKKECPYCHSAVGHIIYANDRPMREYAFYCDCTKGDLMFNDHMAYQAYLEEREINNMTNYDKYFDDGRTYKEFEQFIDEWCGKEEFECEDCPYGQVGKIIANHAYGTCADLFKFLEKKINVE